MLQTETEKDGRGGTEGVDRQATITQTGVKCRMSLKFEVSHEITRGSAYRGPIKISECIKV